MIATARRSGGWESIGGQLTCRDSGFVQHEASVECALDALSLLATPAAVQSIRIRDRTIPQ